MMRNDPGAVSALRFRSIVLCLLAFSTVPIQAAQESKGTAVSKVERKNRAPVSTEVLQPKLPRPQELVLDNGLTVLILEDARFPLVSIYLQIEGAGPIYEPRESAGLANAAARMLVEGTKKRSSQQIAEEIEELGASLSTSASFGSAATVIRGSGLSENIEPLFALLTDVLLHPTFPAGELNKLKERLKVQLRRQRASPSFLARERFRLAVYGSHPAAVVAPTLKSLEALTPKALVDWHRSRFSPKNAILGIAGRVRASELVPKLKHWFGEWKKSGTAAILPPSPSPTRTRQVHLVNRPGSVQTTILMGNIAIDRRHKDYVPMVVMNRILGGGAASRLFIKLREEKGYTYGAYSHFTALQYPGPWMAIGDMRTEATRGAMEEFGNEIARIREEEVPEAELEEIKRSVVSSFALSLERPRRLLVYAITRKLYDFPLEYWDTYPAKIMGVTAKDVLRVANTYLDPSTFQVVAVGNREAIEEVLAKHGPVRIYDTEGKRVDSSTLNSEQ